MRIISGRHRGKRIVAPKKLPVRPTTDMVKEALFNILHNSYSFENIRVLDLYAGTGNISYEFASRGVPEIIAVDADARCAHFIATTAKQLEAPIQVVKLDALRYLERAVGRYDIIFADPPYDLPLEEMAKIPEMVFERGLLTEEGILVIEHSKHLKMEALPGQTESRKYGGSVLSFFEPK
ncbi:MAG: RsmD family RNA methyltransferase [Bacteroidia bacterium]|nr:RsmD family RNA methyltransferase [Bacteroidia bacterium]